MLNLRLGVLFFALAIKASVASLTGNFFGTPQINAAFDYVVVGGGTSGLTVAKRLAETEGISVAVIEAGGFYEFDNGNVSVVPAYALQGVVQSTGSDVNWGFYTTPQPQLGGRTVPYNQGRTLGGGSARNYMLYQRSTMGAYQKWADQVGDDSFTFQNLLPYFEKSVNFTPPNLSKLKLSKGENITYDSKVFKFQGGPLHVSYSNYRLAFTKFVINALNTLGVSSIPGLNSGSLIGQATFAFTIDPADETRSSSETSFLQSAIQAKLGIQVYTRTSAKQIIIDKDSKTATGVMVKTDGLEYLLTAKKEVIVAAGAFKTPQLLMVSGVGPSEILDSLNIPVLSDLKGIGQNMWDHPQVLSQYEVDVTTQQAFNDPTFAAQAKTEYLNDQSGLLTNPFIDVVGWSKLPSEYRKLLSEKALSDLSQFPADWPELELYPLAAAGVPVKGSTNYASFLTILVSPTSRGNVTINSTDTDSPPLISPNWLESSTDQELILQGFKFSRDIARATGVVTPVGSEYFPGANVTSDADILTALKGSVRTFWHASCTCAMGKSSDPMSVVSTTGKVRRITSLRVVDASTFPFLPPGHPQSAVYALAEKYADDIKQGR